MKAIHVPSVLVVVLGLLGGVLQYLNQASFGFQHPWDQLITFGLYVVPLFGASVLTGAAFRSALHLSPAVTTLVTTIAAALAAAITTFGWTGEVRGIAEGILAFLAFVGFGAAPAAAVVRQVGLRDVR